MNRFLEESSNNGLFLIDSPTASGKTYSAGHFIYDQHTKDPGRKIFYITTRKSNIKGAYNETKQAFENHGAKEDFVNSAIILKSNLDFVVEKLSEASFVERLKNGKCKELVKNDEFRELRDNVDTYQNLLNSNSGLAKQFQKQLSQSEFVFRNKLSEIIQNMKKTVDARINLILSDYPEIKELYPSIITSKRSIYFLTIDKFFLGNSTIVESHYKFIDKQFLEGAIVILDEIDSSKDSLLKQQIAESDKYRINAFTLLKHIYSSLGGNFPVKMLEEKNPPKEKDDRKHVSSADAFDAIKKFIKGTYDDNHLDYFIKLDDSFKDSGISPFIFKDEIHYSVKDANKKTMLLDVDKKVQYNYIKETAKKAEDSKNLIQVLSSVNGAISSFLQEVAIISSNYMREENIRREASHIGLIDPSSSASSILKAFGLDRDEINALLYSVTSIATTKKDKETGDLVYYDFYKNGFCFFTFQDADDNDLMTDVVLVQLKETPEYFLFRLAKKAKVLGLSATARIDSPLSNYDLAYLESALSNTFHHMSVEEAKKIRDEFETKRQKENKAELKPYPLNIPTLSLSNEESLKTFSGEYFNDKDLQDQFISILRKASDDYDLKRFAKIAVGIRMFFLNPKLKTFLLMANRNIDENGSSLYSLKTIENILKNLKMEHQEINSFRIIPLKSGNFPKYRSDINRTYKIVDKILVCTTYPSAGIGENLQIEDDESDENDSDSLISNKKSPKDLDSIYLEKPTNVLVNLSKNSQQIESSDLIKAIYQFEVIKLKDGLSQSDFYANIRQAVRKTKFICNGVEPDDFYPQLYKKPSVINAILKVLNQAVGRICRTTKKAPDTEVDIYYDSEIDTFDFSSFDDKLVNREFKAFVECIKGNKKSLASYSDFDSLVESDCRNIDSRLSYLLSETRESWNEEQMSKWDAIREFIIKNPTISKEKFVLLPYTMQHFYMLSPDKSGKPFNRYWFLKKNDNNEVDYERDSFNHLQLFSQPTKGAFEVSDEDCGLLALSSISSLKKHFEDASIPTSFAFNDYMLNPIAYNNFYKGALGEFIGYFLMKDNGMPLVKITDGKHFEKFDYFYANKNVFVDFKLWKESAYFKEEEYKKKEYKKLNKVGSNKGVVVSIVADRCYQYQHYRENGKSLLTIPSLVIPSGNTTGYKVNMKFMGILLDFIRR